MLSPTVLLSALVGYFALLLLVSRLVGRGSQQGNGAFFRANGRSPWPLVAFGMIGASISGVSFISVPGYVGLTQMTYLQMCMGFFLGYLLVAFVLLPVFYSRRLTSIYGYLEERFGPSAHRTGASFFLLSKLARACASFYLASAVLQQFIFAPLGIPYAIGMLLLLLLVWLYTQRSGLLALVYTDTLQTLCMLGALVGLLWMIGSSMHLSLSGMVHTIAQSDLSRVFVFDDWSCRQSFWKQFLSGIFIVIVMTGLDQDMMQKNLTCRTLRHAQKDMCSYGFCFIPVNLLFLSLGVLLYQFCHFQDLPIPAQSDELLPTLVQANYFGPVVTLLFVLGVTAAAFSSVDSALTALTTSFCIDILWLERRFPQDDGHVRHIRRMVHFAVVMVFLLCTWLFRAFNSTSVIDAVYVMASYTYGPVLGLFAYGLLCRKRPVDRLIPVIALLAPVLCYVLSVCVPRWTGYHFGYELLMLNGLLTCLGLHLTTLFRRRKAA